MTPGGNLANLRSSGGTPAHNNIISRHPQALSSDQYTAGYRRDRSYYNRPNITNLFEEASCFN